MTYAALVSLSHTIDQILNPDKYTISLLEALQITSIDDRVIFLQAFLEDFPEKANSTLERRIRDAANQAEDAVEYFKWEQIHSHHAIIKSSIRPDKNHFEHHPKGKYTHLSHELQKVREEFDSVVTEATYIRNSFRIKDVAHSDSPVASSSQRLEPSHEKEAVVGLDHDLLAIKSRLCGESCKRQVIPILGMGGIGKTTLARNAYHDPLITEHFQIRAWVTVSQDYSVQEILSRLLLSINPEQSSRKSNGSVAENVYKSLKGKRYLIVLDDMWSINVWDDLNMIFPSDNNGSRIMLTTRLSDVASYPDSSSPLHEMHFMDADQSWNLLQQKVFTHENCSLELEDVGKKVARSCRGLPLAIVMIGGLLSTVSRTRASWEEIAENVNAAVATKDGRFEKILFLSYARLPHHLRPCFLYMSAFPEDHNIHASNLVKLWIAEGFLKCSNGFSKSLEEAAEEYLEDLVKTSLVLATERKSNGKIKSCNVHDLVRDFCIRKAKEEKCLHLIDSYDGKKILLEAMKNQRRLSITHAGVFRLADIHGPSIRTILSFKHTGVSLIPCAKLRLLRLLHIVDAPTSFLPNELFELFSLRYLAFCSPSSIYGSFSIPEAISNLQNLQTLIIHIPNAERDYPRLIEVSLPLKIWRMPHLRHLVCFVFQPLPNPEESSFLLEDLQTLSMATNFVCTQEILTVIPNLKKLGVFYYRHNKYNVDYQLNNLAYLQRLEKLKLVVFPGFPDRRMLNPVFPGTLKKLTLSCLLLPWEDMTVIGSLPNLRVLKLRNYACKGDTWETSEGEFQELRYLVIDQSGLQHWITESSHFPRLRSLVLHRCWCLSEIPYGIGEIPTLEVIEVSNCPKENNLLVESAKLIQEEQRDCGNDALQVRIITW